jgi:hypothetical protein
MEDCGSYYLSKAEQGSQEWLDIRASLKITGSNFYKASRYVEGKGDKPNTGPIVPNEAMRFGTTMEPVIRDWFARTYSMIINEVGIAVPKDYPVIGSSVDGVIMVGNKKVGIIEIKTTKSHHYSLIDEGRVSPYHYAQIQGGMNIMDLPYCYYISFSRETGKIHVVKVKRNIKYWTERLLPALRIYQP